MTCVQVRLKLKFHLYELLIIGDYCFKRALVSYHPVIYLHTKFFVHAVEECAFIKMLRCACVSLRLKSILLLWEDVISVLVHKSLQLGFKWLLTM